MSLFGLAFLLAAIAATTPAPDSDRTDPIVIGVVDARPEGGVHKRAHDDVQRGVEFGAHEMAQTARLLGRDVRVVEGREAAPYGWIVIRGTSPSPDHPVIHVGTLPAAAGACEFALGLPGHARPEGRAYGNDRGVRHGEVLWHPSLDRFGASELNERFARRFDLPMTADAWAGWAAVKALVESALRRRPDESPCAALARLRFDGHKGQPLYFDGKTRTLVQPAYVLKDGRVAGERK